jgi:microcystin-dependent protein
MTINAREGGTDGIKGLIGRNSGDGAVTFPNGDANGVNSTNSDHTHTVPAHTTNTTGGNLSHENRPPYFALCFIIKWN